MGEHFYCKFENWMCKLVAGLKIARVKISGVKIAIMKISGMKISGMKIAGMKIPAITVNDLNPFFSLRCPKRNVRSVTFPCVLLNAAKTTSKCQNVPL